MSTFESPILSYLANSLWQIPLIFAAGWLAARALRSLGPAAEHRVWVAALILQAMLPAGSIIPWQHVREWLNFGGVLIDNGLPHVSVISGPGTVFGNPHISSSILHLIAVVYIAVTAWFAARFIWRLCSVRRLRRNATEVAMSSETEAYWSQCERTFDVKGAWLGTSDTVYGPITIGIRHKLVLLQPDMLAALAEPELHTAIAHEFVHMRRQDYFKNLIYEFVSLPARFHPVLSITRNRLMETREMVCDQLAAGFGNERQYARSLLRLATLLVEGVPATTPHTIGIFDATTFERRVMRLTEKPAQISKVRRFAAAALCSLLGVGISAATLALSVHVDALAQSERGGPSQGPKQIAVDAKTMENQITHKVTPVYPPEAKKARLQGKVTLDAVIGKEGEMEQIKVVSGPKELQQSALDAVRQWTYKPYPLNGQPVEVRTTIDVRYTLAQQKGSNPGKE